MAKAIIEIQDEVNVRIKGLDPVTLDSVINKMSFYVPNHHFKQLKIVGRWDGKIRLCTKTGKTYLNLLDDILPVVQKAGYSIDIEDNRINFDPFEVDLIDKDYLKDYNDKEGKPIQLWDHQIEAVNRALTEGCGILELATGAGKTFCCGILSKIYQVYGSVVVIVPTIDLVLQTQYAFRDIGIDTGVWFGDIKDRKQTTIGTWQSLDHFAELFHDVVCFINDETHQAKAKVLNEMLTGPAANVPIRYGCSGTLPKEELFRKQILAAIGPTLYTIRAWELQEKGVLAKSSIYQVSLKDSNDPDYKEKITDPRKVAKSKKLDDPIEWRDETNWMFSNRKRVKYIADFVTEVATTGNTLVLVSQRKYGELIQELVNNSVYMDGREKNKTKRRDTYQALNQSDNGILISTGQLASTGIDIPRLFNIVIIELGKDFIKINQTLGRGLRKASDKHHLNLFDLCSDSGICGKHARDRVKLFHEAKQEIERIEADYQHVPII